MEHNPVGWFEIYVQDMDRARKFYEAVFETTLEKLPGPNIEMWTFPMNSERRGSSGALVKAPGMDSGGNSVVVYFSCEDCAVEAGVSFPVDGSTLEFKDGALLNEQMTKNKAEKTADFAAAKEALAAK